MGALFGGGTALPVPEEEPGKRHWVSLFRKKLFSGLGSPNIEFFFTKIGESLAMAGRIPMNQMLGRRLV